MKVLCGQSGVPRAPASFIMERKWHLNPPYSTQLPADPSPQTLRAEQLSPSCLEAKFTLFFCHGQNVDASKLKGKLFFPAVYPHPMIHNCVFEQYTWLSQEHTWIRPGYQKYNLIYTLIQRYSVSYRIYFNKHGSETFLHVVANKNLNKIQHKIWPK